MFLVILELLQGKVLLQLLYLRSKQAPRRRVGRRVFLSDGEILDEFVLEPS